MSDMVRILAGAAAVWAAAAMLAQAAAVRKGAKREYSTATGSPWRGVLYSFTGAMLPWRKETVSLHRFEFLIGILMHAGIVWALAALAALIVRPQTGLALLRPGLAVFLLSFAAALFLLVRRAHSSLLRSFSAPDDYVAVVATALFLLAAALGAVRPASVDLFLAAGFPLLLYVPLGKLRHAVFFFLARGAYGMKLGHRGVYPPPSAKSTLPARME